MTAIWRICVCLATLTAAHALEPGKPFGQYHVRRWNLSTGLPLQRIRMAAQTPEGEIWLAAQSGELMRFEGRSWRRPSTSVADSIRAGFLLPDPERGLLVLSPLGQGFHLEGDSNIRMTMDRPLPSPVAAAARDGEGRLWVATAKDLFYWDDSDVKLWRNPGFGQIFGLATGESGDLWVAAREGVFRIRGRSVGADRLLAGSAVTSIARGAGRMWAAVRGEGIFELRGDEVIPSAWNRRPDARQPIYAVLEDRHQNLWLSLAGGLARVTSDGAELIPVAGARGAEDRWIWEDREGQVWFGLGAEGLLQAADTPFSTYGEGEGFSGAAWNVLEDQEQRIWAGADAGLYVRRGGDWRLLTRVLNLPEGRPAALLETRAGDIWAAYREWAVRLRVDRVLERVRTGVRMTSLVEMPDGSILGAAPERGLIRVRQGVAERVDPLGELCANPRVLARGAGGKLYAGCVEGGVYVNAGAEWRPVETGARRPAVEAIYEDPRGTLWVGSSQDGLCRIRDGQARWFRTRTHGAIDDVHSIVEDATGHFWLSSNSGLRRIPRRDLEEAADDGRTEFHFEYFAQDSGLRDSEFYGGSQPSGWLAKDGSVWFPSRSGPVKANANFRFHAPAALFPLIGELRLAGKPMEFGSGKVEFVAAASRLSVDLRLPAYSRPYQISYRLTGFDENWIPATDGQLSYTNLPPGRYNLFVRAAAYQGEPGEPRKLLEIEVRPPFFRTKWFVALTALLLVALGGLGVWVRVASVRRRNQQLEDEVRRRTAQLEEALRNEKQAAASALARQRDLEQTREQLQQETEERRLVEYELAEARKMESIDRLATGAAHDFNNLLTVIFANVELARMAGELPHGVAGLLDEIEFASKRASDLTRQLLTFARRHVAQPRRVDLNHLTADVSRLLRRMVGSQIELSLSLAPEPVVVRVDPVQFEQVLINLVVNARDAMPSGGRIVVSTRTKGEQGLLMVSDNGVGMNAEIASRIFEPFFTTKERSGGTGLGLAICYGVVRQAGGEITVQSKPGAGSRFTVSLPLMSPASLEPPVAARGATASGD